LMVVVVAMAAWDVFGQEGGDRGRRGGDGQGFNREEAERRAAEWRAERLKRLKEEMKPENDEEWQVLEAKIKEISDVRRRSYGFGGPGGPGGPGGFGGFRREGEQQSADPYQQARNALHELVGQPGASNDAIKAALEKVRTLGEEARKKREEDEKRREAERAEARKKAEALQQELRGIVTLRQEAVLVYYGLLQ